MAVNLRHLYMTKGDDSQGVAAPMGLFVAWGMGLFTWILVDDLYIIVVIQALLLFTFTRGILMFTDARLLWHGVERLRPLPYTQAVKTARLVTYLKYQNPVLSYLFSRMSFVSAQYWSLLLHVNLMLWISQGSPLLMQMLCSCPLYLLIVCQPCHDTVSLYAGLLSVGCFMSDWYVWGVLFGMLAIWSKFLTPSIWRQQRRTYQSYTHYNLVTRYKSWVEVPLVLGLTFPLWLTPAAIVIVSGLILRSYPKYYIYLWWGVYAYLNA